MALGVATARATAVLPARPQLRRLACRRPSRALVVTRAASDFDLAHYTEAVVAEVRATEKHGHIVLLRLKDEAHSLLPVYIGEFECGALVKEINKKPTQRPLTHDLMKSSLEALGFRVAKVRITALVGNTYHARVHYARARGAKPSPETEAVGGPSEWDVDARPSDAINLAVRFGSPIYVNNEVATKMGHPGSAYEPPGSSGGAGGGGGEHRSEVERSCREEIASYHDPTIMHKLQMQLAIAEERFEDATSLRDTIDRILASDRALSLVVAMETALEDGRHDEAARLRDEFKALKQAQALSQATEIGDSAGK